MTHEAKQRLQNTSWKLLSNFLLAAVASFGTHLIDVTQVIPEQKKNSEWRVISQVKIKNIEEVELPTLLRGEYYANKRLCKLLIEYGQADKECDAELYTEHPEWNR